MILNRSIFFVFLICFACTSCSEFLDVGPPKSKIENSVVFNDDITASAAVIGIYSEMLNAYSFASGTQYSLTALAGLSSGEFVNVPRWDASSIEFEVNEIRPENEHVLKLWSSMYRTIYQCNSVVEGLEVGHVSEETKIQLLGEVLFTRAFAYYYLVNLFGEVPIVLTTDYKLNSDIGRSSVEAVYMQIKNDLDRSVTLLSDKYVAPGGERIRPNRYVALALKSRICLSIEDWSGAEATASEVISMVDQYGLEFLLEDVFLKNSRETIWQLRPLGSDDTGMTNEAGAFSPSGVTSANALHKSILLAFEKNDDRLLRWIDTVFVGTDTVFVPYKYRKFEVEGDLTEYSMVIRLAEIYLNRAEARVMQGILLGDDGAESDINAIRNRAGLPNTSASTEGALMEEINRERLREFFSEWGHGWLNLKRQEGIVEYINSIKGDGFTINDELYPIPYSEFTRNRSLIRQNPGY